MSSQNKNIYDLIHSIILSANLVEDCGSAGHTVKVQRLQSTFDKNRAGFRNYCIESVHMIDLWTDFGSQFMFYGLMKKTVLVCFKPAVVVNNTSARKVAYFS